MMIIQEKRSTRNMVVFISAISVILLTGDGCGKYRYVCHIEPD